MPSRRRAEVGYGVSDLAACRAEALSKTYGRRDTAVHALREITLSIPSHAFTAIMGPSGSGKSTLLHCLAALDTPSSGRVFLGQTELTSLSRRQQAQVRRDRIGFVFQSFNLVPTLDAIENITLPQLLAGRRPNREWLEYVVAQIGLRDRLHHRPSQLSGGQQQRVALARALAGRPEVIFADEPTGNLDTKASREMLALLRSAVDDFRQTVVTVTHDPAIAGYADQVLFFTDGQVVDQVLYPEQDLVLEHLQYLDSSTPAYEGPRRQLRASMQEDGQHIMRSRRRRRADETVPGRPMVGDDDEVEVARQERWLQRIREQFDVEHEAAHASNGYHPGDASADTGNGYPPEPGYDTGNGHITSNGHHPEPAYDTGNGHITGNGYHPEPAYDTGNGHNTSNGYHPEPAYDTNNNGYAAEGYHTGNGFDSSPRDTGNGFHDRPHDTANGYHAEPAYDSHNGHHDTRHIVSDTYQTAQHTIQNGYHTGDGHQTAGPTYDTGNGHTADTGDEGWLPAERSWMSNEYPAERAPEPVQHAPEPASDSQNWHSDTWNASEPTQRWLPPARAEIAPAATQPAALPARSWREERTREPADDVWSSPSTTTSDGEWATIPPPTSSPPVSSTGQWDTSQPPEQNGWSPPQTSYEPADTPARNGHNTETGWQRWEPDPYVTRGNGADPAFGGERNGHHSDIGNGHHSDVSNGHHGDSGNGHRAVDQPDQEETWPDGNDDEPERIEDPVRGLLDIWSPKSTTADGWQQEAPSYDAAPDGTAPYGDTPNVPAASSDGDQWQATSRWEAPEQSNGHPTNGWGAPEQNGHHTTGGWESADGWQVDYTPGANHEPRELPPEDLTGPTTSTTTDPFEALHSLQSQLNRLGSGRRAPRRYED